MCILLLYFLITLLTEVEPLIIEEDRTLSECQAKNMKVRCFLFVESQAIFEYQTYVFPKFIIGFINVKIDLIENSS